MRRALPTALLVLAAAAPLAAQGIDRTRAPALGPAPALALPRLVEGTLPNGLGYTLVEMHEVPLVQVTLRVRLGARFDGPTAGLATFTANMLDEGAGGRDALGIAAEAEYLGATLRTFADWNAMGVALNVPTRSLDPALALLADVALRPTFPAAEVARQRDLRLAAIIQQRDQPGGMAQLAFASVMFPARHPYRRPINGDSASTVRLDSAAVRQFWAAAFAPAQAHVIITGDITPPEVAQLLATHFGAWRAAPSARALPPLRPPPPLVRPAGTQVYLVDKPGAAQSVVLIGQPGVVRNAPDWAATEVMNTILGGSFSSRLNTVLRETKGYTYGASSRFDYNPLPGPWVASSQVRTDVTDSALVEFLREFRRLRDSTVAPDELERARQYLVLGLAGDFETTTQVAGQIAAARTLGLPWAWYARYQPAIRAVTATQVQAAARRVIAPERLVIVVVGDLARIRPGIEQLALGTVTVVDLEGRPVGR